MRKSKPFGSGFGGIKIRFTTVLRRRTEEEVEEASVSFESCLTEAQKKLYLTEIKPFLDHNREIINDTQSFDLRIAQRYILNRVLELGWHPNKHGRFDEGIGHPYENARKPKRVERIAKKYQWIAYYEFVAKLADNYQFKEGHYQGPWEPFLRDIDPTTTLRKQEDEKLSSFWWTPQPYSNWELSEQEWIEDTADFPDPVSLIQTIDPSGNEWLVLESDNSWNQPTEIGKDQYDSPHKHIWYQLKSYIVPLEDHRRIVNKLKGKDFSNDWMPSSNSRYEVFHREYYWAPACESYRRENYPEYNWSEIITDGNHEFVGSTFITTNEYSSSEDQLNFYMPSEILFTLMNLRHGKIEGEMVNEKGEVVCFDPSASKSSKSLLLVRKNHLHDMLQANGLSIFWTQLGRKEIIGHAHLLRELTLSGITEYTKNKLQSTAWYVK